MIVATVGYRLIHIIGRIATVVGAIGFTYLAVRMLIVYDVPALLGQKPFEFPTFLLAVSLGAAWQLTFGPYVADYSRYLPRSTKESATFWGTFLGSVIGSQWSMTLGAIVAYSVGHCLGREFMARHLKGRLLHFERAVANRGIIAVMASRMVPVAPFGISNYVFGTTSVRFLPFVAGTLLGALPATLAYAALGSATAHHNATGMTIAGAVVATLGVGGSIGTLLIWRRRPRRVHGLPAAATV